MVRPVYCEPSVLLLHRYLLRIGLSRPNKSVNKVTSFVITAATDDPIISYDDKVTYTKLQGIDRLFFVTRKVNKSLCYSIFICPLSYDFRPAHKREIVAKNLTTTD